MEFGFYPESCDLTAGDVRISTLPGLETKRLAVVESKWVHNDWIYAPPLQVRDIASETVADLSLLRTHLQLTQNASR